MNGLINVLKPPGLTSHDVVKTLRRLFATQKIGHTGTLDPGAAGVLPVCTGQGTRVAEYLIDKKKTYRAEIAFGIATDSHDAGGKVVVRQASVSLSYDRIIDVLGSFVGEIKQVPPMVSAVQVGGKRLYQLARQGRAVERKPRRVTIYDLKPVRFNDTGSYPRLLLDVTCSKGTYVRSLGADMGSKLGCGAYLSFLIRTASGRFTIEDAYTLEQIRDMWDKGDRSFLLPIDYGLSEIPSLTVKEKAVATIRNGLPLSPSGICGGIGASNLPPFVRFYGPDGTLLALGQFQEQLNGAWTYKLTKVFNLPATHH
ncbi:MAG: tRNA pseudouridine(55) synthase TruB [Thermacetogeniaceae bacterium]|jgi:tRNA pseudouridine55 synthase